MTIRRVLDFIFVLACAGATQAQPTEQPPSACSDGKQRSQACIDEQLLKIQTLTPAVLPSKADIEKEEARKAEAQASLEAKAKAAPHITRRCVDLKGAVVWDCVMYLTDAEEQTDDYMRKLFQQRAMNILAARNEPYLVERAAKQSVVDQTAAAASDKRAREAVKRAVDAETAAQAKRREECLKLGVTVGSVRIGMRAATVVSCGWGKPNSVSRTTTADGTTEQWMYGMRSYLYFANGVLTTIQN